MKYLFLDTNIFIHFISYEQIPWNEIVGDDYKLIIAPIVLDELDKHKTNQNKKISGRVKKILPKIEQEQTNINSIVDVNLPIPKDDTFNKFNLSKSQQDHALLSTMLEFGEKYGLKNLVFISYDTGPRIRARHLGIYVLQLDDKYLLSEEESQEEIELRKLRKENTELKNTFPKVELTFNDGEVFKKIEISPLLQSEEDYTQNELNIVYKTHKPFAIENAKENDINTNISDLSNDLKKNLKWTHSLEAKQPTVDQKEEYNRKLNLFYSEYDKIAKVKYKWDKIISNSVMLNLILSNNGTAPANDIDVFLEFPSSVKIYFYKDFPKFEKPTPPYKPKYKGDFDISGLSFNYTYNPPAKDYIYIIDKSIKESTLEKYDIEYLDNDNIVVRFKYSNSLKHNMHFSLEPIWVLCNSNFYVKYKLLISNYPKQVEGKLNINVSVNYDLL